MQWTYLIHLGANMWGETPPQASDDQTGRVGYAPYLRCDDEVWRVVTENIAAAGFTHLLIDLGDGVQYSSHPEISVEGAWTTTRLGDELDRLRNLGLTPLPKLNFSATHDDWLGEYGRMVSTPRYYEVCADLISEVAVLFDRPSYFHLGMDEETYWNQRGGSHVVIRQGDLWRSDSLFLFDCVRTAGSRPWVWSDPAWSDPISYFDFMPKDVLQSNWHYGLWFGAADRGRPRALEPAERFLTYLDLHERGYDQVPTASTWRNTWDNLEYTVTYCESRLDTTPAVGYLQTPWALTMPNRLAFHMKTIERSKSVITEFQRRG